MRNKTIMWALAVLATAHAGCCSSSCRNLLHRGSPCGTAMAAPIAAPVAMAAPLQAPQVAPVMAPVMAPAPMQQFVMPQQQMICCPQQLPCCPQPMPCCPPMQMDPCCQGGIMSGSYMEGDVTTDCGPTTSFDEGYLVPGSETPVGSDSSKDDPRPAQEN